MFVSQEESGTENSAAVTRLQESEVGTRPWDEPHSEPVGGAPGINWARVIHILRLSRQHLRHSLQFTEHV